MTALLQRGSSPRAAGRVVTSSGACDTGTLLLDMPINAPKYRYNPVCNFIQAQMGSGQYRCPRHTIKLGNTGKQRLEVPLGHCFPALLERKEAQGQVLGRISTSWCNLAPGCPHYALELDYLCPTAGLPLATVTAPRNGDCMGGGVGAGTVSESFSEWHEKG